MTALGLVFLLALPLLAMPVLISSAATSVPDKSGDDASSADGKDANNGRKCPNCNCLMKPCPVTSDYKWVCHSCGYSVPR